MIMKKYFIFAALVTAGLLTSCSSSDDAISETPNVPTSNESDLVAIKIGVAKPTASITRGTGTVGGVVDNLTDNHAVNNDGTTTGTPLANSWAGQKVNVYMFNHGTLTVAQFDDDGTPEEIYNNAVLATPAASSTGIADYLVPEAEWATPGTAERFVKYYPTTGSYDFWGYRIDDATAAAPAVDGDVLKTVISVNGTQDVLSGVAKIPANYAAIPDPSALKTAVDAYATAQSITNEAAYTFFKDNRLFSASAARANIQPELEFSHMMTRLTFEAYAGSDNAKAVVDGDGNATNFDPAAGDEYTGVYVTGIKVRAIKSVDNTDPTAPVITYADPTKGTFEIAGTGATFAPSLTWDDTTTEPAAFELMKRAAFKHNTNGSVISLETYNALDAGDKANYTAITNEAAENLVPLVDNTIVTGTPAAPDYLNNGAILLWNTATDGSVKNAIGEAIIAPSTAAYELEISLCQDVVVKETLAGVVVEKKVKKWNTIKTTYRAAYDAADNTTFFQPGTSYNFKIKVYGLERIEITTTLKPWVFGENIDVNLDD